MMVKLPIVFILFCSSIVIGSSESLFDDNKTLIRPAFRVYTQDTMTGPNATLVEVARANVTSTSTTLFGLVVVVDNFLMAGPDPKSQKLGRTQGFVFGVGRNEGAISVNFNFVFTAGRYKGSSLTAVVGRKLILGKNQEVPIVGGTGDFRMARGYTISSLVSSDPSTLTNVNVYDFYVVGLGRGI